MMYDHNGGFQYFFKQAPFSCVLSLAFMNITGKLDTANITSDLLIRDHPYIRDRSLFLPREGVEDI